MVKAYLKEHPTTPEIEAALQRALDQGNPPRSLRPTHPKAVLFRELAWFADPRSRKKPHDPPRGWLKDRYAPKVILASLIAATVYIEERDRSFPGDSAEVALGYVLASHWKRPRYPAGHPVPLRATTRRLLAKRIREGLGVFLLTAARAVIAQRQKLEALTPKRPQKPQPPPPTIWTPEPARPMTAGGWPAGIVTKREITR